MKLFFEKIGFYLLPILLFLVVLVLILVFFRFLLKKISDPNIKRVVNSLSFAILAVLSSLAISSYRKDVPLSVGLKIGQIEVAQAEVEAEKVRKEEERLEKEAHADEVADELETALEVAGTEKDLGMGGENKKSQIITEEWLKKYRKLIKELPDELEKDSYSIRFDNVQEYFLSTE